MKYTVRIPIIAGYVPEIIYNGRYYLCLDNIWYSGAFHSFDGNREVRMADEIDLVLWSDYIEKFKEHVTTNR